MFYFYLSLVLTVGGCAAAGLVLFYRVDALNSIFADAETLFLPAFQALASVAVGALGLLNWGPLLGLVQSGGFSRDQLIGVAAVSFLQAVGMYLARRARDPELK